MNNDSFYLNWECANCTLDCNRSDHYIAQRCNVLNDAVCLPCTICPSGKYKTRECTKFENTECTSCSISCSLNHFMKSQCNRTHDMVCEKCKPSCPATQGYYVEYPCRFLNDTLCSKCPEGSIPDPDTNAFCVKCPRGTTVSVENVKCDPCEGYVSANKTLCMREGKCPLNEYIFDESSCAFCPATTFGLDGLRCEPCIFGQCEDNTVMDAIENYSYPIDELSICSQKKVT